MRTKKAICIALAIIFLSAFAAPAVMGYSHPTQQAIVSATKKKVKPVYKGKKKTGVRITYYCACPSCNGYWSSWRNGAWSTATAKGVILYNKSAYKWKYCAATPAVGKLGQTVTLYLDGKWRELKIVDRLGSNTGKKIDIFWPSHSGCYKRGVINSKTVYIK